MRINKFVAASTGMSRRGADQAIEAGRVQMNRITALSGLDVQADDIVTLDGKQLRPAALQTIMLHKPAGYVTSREGQGGRTIYDLLPQELHHLKPVGRLDKDSSGLLLLTNDGGLAQQLTHPSFQKIKEYDITIDQPLQPLHRQMISDFGIQLDDGASKLILERRLDSDDTLWKVSMREGRNRQIRRTFSVLGYEVTKLHRTRFGAYHLGDLKPGAYRLARGDPASSENAPATNGRNEPTKAQE